MELIKEIERLKTENELLKKELNDTKEHLKKYTAPSRSKTYYENHKEEIKQRVNEYKERTDYNSTISKERKKEYNKIAYQKRKEKSQESKNHIQEN